MEAKDIGGVLAGGLIATELLDTLVTKGLLTKDDARGVLQRVARSIGPNAAVRRPEAAAALSAIQMIVQERFPEDK
jgi:polyhydroxyalkanoate synthesis regulator phasin